LDCVGPKTATPALLKIDVNRSEAGPGLVRKPFDRRFVGHVSHDADRLRTVRFEPRHGFAQSGLFDVREHKLDTLAGKGSRRRKPDAARAAGDDGGPAFQFPHSPPLLDLFPLRNFMARSLRFAPSDGADIRRQR
jgi:hypothetical protein